MAYLKNDSDIHGRGASWNPPNRFDQVGYEEDPEVEFEPHAEDIHRPATEYIPDHTKSILAHNDSPDVGFDVGINPYRGCEHGCIYCYARPTHEYLGYSAGLDFETRILVKHNAPALLRDALSSPKWRPQVIAVSGNTDCYQPVERKLRITRACFEVLAEYLNPAVIITKNRLVTRDIDLFRILAEHNAISVNISVTTLDLELNRKLEPRSSSPAQRLDAIRMLSDAGIPTGIMIAPVVPSITDHEMPAILRACREAGATRAGFVMLRLPHAVAPLFEQWLEQHFPDRKEKVLHRMREMRGGKLYKSEFGARMRGEGPFAEQVGNMFKIACKKEGLNLERTPLNTAAIRRPGQDQLMLNME